VDNLRSDSKLVRFVTGAGAFEREPVVVVDVGCSGGLHRSWQSFGAGLVGYGFDANVSECERLSVEGAQRVQYVPAMVGLSPTHPFIRDGGNTYWHSNPWNRLSTAHASARLPDGERARRANVWRGDSRSEETVVLPEWLRSHGVDRVDFLKIDVDGPDLIVLTSMLGELDRLRVLGVAVEVNFFGTAAYTDHTFHNTDRLLRECGFDLFDLSTRHYSSASLPAPFIADVPGPTRSGRILQGDALYLRDACADGACSFSPGELLKLCCFFDLARMPDIAAEILVRFRLDLEPIVNVDTMLDILAPNGRYREWLASFEADDRRFYRHRIARSIMRRLPASVQVGVRRILDR
jgi:hypothetical protein